MKISNDNYEVLLDQLLDEDVSLVQKRSENYFSLSEEKIKNNGLILYGCGGFGKKVLKGLRKIGIEPIGFVESNQKLWGTFVDGLCIMSPEEAVKKYPDAVFMLTIWSDVNGHPFGDVNSKLHSYGKVNLISFFYLFWKYPDVFLPYFSIDLPIKTIRDADLIKKCFSLFSDEISKREFVAQIKWRLWADHEGLSEPVQYFQYFPDDLLEIYSDEVFVDCGAFDGDTLKNFLKKQKSGFGKYIGFEPDPLNFEKLNKFVSDLPKDIREKIIVEPYAVSDTKKVIKFSSDGSVQSSFSESGNINVDCISIDEHLANEKITYIKMDAEGAEPEIISGAVATIKTHKPILAVSVYHQFDHLWVLPLAIEKISDDYQLFLRPHCKSSWDLVCYAIPKARLQ